MGHADEILVGSGEESRSILLRLANRHGLITGATGTGKTVTLQILAEGFAERGVPVFVADVKGDLSGLGQAGDPGPKLIERAREIGVEDYEARACPVIFWDLYGEKGHPLRTTISEMGPLLLSRLMDLNDTQEGVLDIAFRVADDQGLLLLDLKDLRSLLTLVSESAAELKTTYGNVSKASVGAILRRLLSLEQEGADRFFSEPALQLAEFMRTDRTGRGIVNILAADRLMTSPRLYSTCLLWLLSELFEELPEVGDHDKPKLVFFFDEAHLLFNDAPKALLEKIEQVVRLIRSKGVGICFVSQNPLDIPDRVLGQLGNRVQHALRAFTPRDQKAVKVAAETFRPNLRIDTVEAITALGVGEALVSTLDAKGIPTVVERVRVRPPSSRMGPLTTEERAAIIKSSPVAGLYDTTIDRESAYEMLSRRAEKAEGDAPAARGAEKTTARRSSSRQGFGEALAKSVLRSIGSQVGRQIVRGILGSLFKAR